MTQAQLFTNEEKRVVLYTDTQRPTIPAEVTPETTLESLNLNWCEKDLPERERTKHVHRLHPYLGKFIPQLVEIFLRKYFSPGQTILDPFAGSGTALLQANELGINSIGYDISAFNIILCRAKTGSCDIKQLRFEILDILEKVRAQTQTKQQSTLWSDEFLDPELSLKLTQSESHYLHQWFAPQSLHELLTYRALIDIGGYHYRDLLQIILSRSARSARLTTHFDLDFPKCPQTTPYWCYKHSRECSPTTEAFKFLERYSLDAIERVREFAASRTNATVTIHHADSREVSIPPIDGVITSPPYVGLIDYHEQHAYGYHLLGLEDRREKEIGPAAKGSSQRARQQYQKDIAQVFRKAAQSMPSGARMIVVAADRANLYEEIANLAGVEIEATVQRHVNRRTGRRSSEFYESVFIWRKP